MPKGFRRSARSQPRVAVLFPEELFTRIKEFAEGEEKTFSEAVCELCEVGLFDLEESDALEPAAHHSGRTM